MRSADCIIQSALLFLSVDFKKGILLAMPNNPPPYFPQSQLSPPDPNRYRKFKLTIAAVAIVLILLIGAIGVGIYYLIRPLF
jgi:hypothetical protein